MASDPRTRSLSEICAERGPNRPLHTKSGGQDYLEKSLAAAAEPFKGITNDGNVIPGLFRIQKTGVSTQSIREAADAFLSEMFNMRLSRDKEDGADERGTLLAVQAGYAPSGLLDFLKILATTNAKPGSITPRS